MKTNGQILHEIFIAVQMERTRLNYAPWESLSDYGKFIWEEMARRVLVAINIGAIK